MSRCQSSTKLADVTRSTFVVGNLRLLRMMMAPSGGHAAGTLRLRTRAGKRKRAPEMVSCAALENSTKSAEEFIDEKYGRIEKTNPRWLDLSGDWEQQPKIFDRGWATTEMI